MSSIQIFVPIVFLFSFTNAALNTTITFWSGSDGHGQSKKYLGINIRRKCRTLPELEFKVRSIATDTCIQFFPTKSCAGGSMQQIDRSIGNWPVNGPNVQSWILCRQRNLNVTIYNNSDWDQPPLVEYFNLCKCVNIPNELQHGDTYVVTGKQEIFMYAKDCIGRHVSSFGGNILKSSLEPSSRPPSCPFLIGLLTDISNFTPTKTPKITQKPLHVTPAEINFSTQKLVSATFTGEDTKSLTRSPLPWRKHLISCSLSDRLTLKQKLSKHTWENEEKLQDEFISSHCKTRDPFDGYYGDHMKEINKPFVVTRNISVAGGVATNVFAKRGYETKYFDYTISFNITGISIETDIVTAEDLENSLPTSGLRFVEKLDDFTVLAEATGSLKSYYPISTKYWTEAKGSLVPDVKKWQ